jgi:hypothetical protein
MWQDDVKQAIEANTKNNHVDLVNLVAGLIEVAALRGELRGAHAPPLSGGLMMRFASGEEELIVRTRFPYLRHIMARLAKVANGEGSLEVNPYGDLAEFLWKTHIGNIGNTVRLRLEFVNHGQGWFTLKVVD